MGFSQSGESLMRAQVLGALERAGLILALMAVWEVWAVLQQASRATPTPANVFQAGYSLIMSGNLQLALWTSIQRVLIGFVIATVIAVPSGLAMGYRRIVEASLDPVVQPLRAVAPIALVPLAIVWFGTGTEAAVFIVAYAACFPILINAIAGVKGVRPQLIRAARVLGLKNFTILRAVVLPAALPDIFVGLRLGLGLSWAAIVAAELAVGAKTGATGGIGQMMFIFFAYDVNPNGIIVCMMTVGLFGFFTEHGLRVIQYRLMPWSR
jgi:ABC-type nitrate/sulfonate/bicarbonate transport system permease component